MKFVGKPPTDLEGLESTTRKIRKILVFYAIFTKFEKRKIGNINLPIIEFPYYFLQFFLILFIFAVSHIRYNMGKVLYEMGRFQVSCKSHFFKRHVALKGY